MGWKLRLSEHKGEGIRALWGMRREHFPFASGANWRLPGTKSIPWAKPVVGLKNKAIVFENLNIVSLGFVVV